MCGSRLVVSRFWMVYVVDCEFELVPCCSGKLLLGF